MNSGDHAPHPARWKALIAAWLGWCFDGLDGYLYVIVAIPFVTQLLENQYGPGNIPPGQVAAKAALIQCVFLVGWAVGGAVFGRIGDRLGRARTLTITVLTYAIFTGLAFFAQTWWHLLIFRFVAALGIGGEWAAGSALVSEVLHRKHRAWASATLQSGYMVGCILAVFTAKVFSQIPVGDKIGLEPRWVFLVGVAPALLTLWIRAAVPEPEHWTRAKSEESTPPLSALFRGQLARVTLLTTALTSIALTTVWAFLYFGPQLLRQLDGIPPEKRTAFASDVSVAYLTVNIIANFAATYTARFLGYRAAFLIFMVGALATFAFVFGHRYAPAIAPALTKDNALGLYCLVAFFGLGLFGMFPLYIPPLFPTLVRTLGAGFTYNVGRLFSAAGALGGGLIAESVGYDGAIFWTAMLYIPGIIVCCFIPEPRQHDEPDPEVRV